MLHMRLMAYSHSTCIVLSGDARATRLGRRIRGATTVLSLGIHLGIRRLGEEVLSLGILLICTQR